MKIQWAGTTRGLVTVIKLSRITTLSLSGIAVMNAVPRDTTDHCSD